MLKKNDKKKLVNREWILTLSILSATIIGGYEFLLKDVIKPKQEPTALNIESKLEKVGEKDSLLLICAEIMAINPTQKRIYIPAFWYSIIGYNLSREKDKKIDNYKEMLDKINGNELILCYAPIISGEIVAQQRIIYTYNAWYEPLDQTNNEIIFAVPKNKFDFLKMNIYYLHTRNVEDIGDTEWFAYNDGIWHANFSLLDNEYEYEGWQEKTSSGINWFETTLSLWEN